MKLKRSAKKKKKSRVRFVSEIMYERNANNCLLSGWQCDWPRFYSLLFAHSGKIPERTFSAADEQHQPSDLSKIYSRHHRRRDRLWVTSAQLEKYALTACGGAAEGIFARTSAGSATFPRVGGMLVCEKPASPTPAPRRDGNRVPADIPFSVLMD